MPFILNCEPFDHDDMANLGAIAIDAMAHMNLLFFNRFPQMAMPARAAGIQYDPPSMQYRTMNHSLCQAPILLQRGVGKCDSITAWDIAWRRLNGEDAFCGIKPQGDGLFHVVTFIRTNGRISEFDCSKTLERFTGSPSCNLNATDKYCEC